MPRLDSRRGTLFVLFMFSTFTTSQPLGFAAVFQPLLDSILLDGAVHEFRAPKDTATHVKFVLVLLAQYAGTAPILWASTLPSAYPPGFAWLGLDPSRCVFAHTKNDAETLGALEVALRGGMIGVAEAGNLSRIAARRLAIAAKQGNSIGFLLRQAPAFTPLDSTAPATRWLITPMPGGGLDSPRLRAELLYAKGGQPSVFFCEINREASNGAPPALTLVTGDQDAASRFRRTG